MGKLFYVKTFSSGFSKTAQASGLKIKPGLRARRVIAWELSKVDFSREVAGARVMGSFACMGGGT